MSNSQTVQKYITEHKQDIYKKSNPILDEDGKTGVFYLLQDKTIVYIGATTIGVKAVFNIKDIPFNRYSFQTCEEGTPDAIHEAAYEISLLKPKFNTKKTKGFYNLKEIHKLIIKYVPLCKIPTLKKIINDLISKDKINPMVLNGQFCLCFEDVTTIYELAKGV